jgi:hypothetical protein
MGLAQVGFGSLADIEILITDVRFTPTFIGAGGMSARCQNRT